MAGRYMKSTHPIVRQLGNEGVGGTQRNAHDNKTKYTERETQQYNDADTTKTPQQMRVKFLKCDGNQNTAKNTTAREKKRRGDEASRIASEIMPTTKHGRRKNKQNP